MLVGIWLVVWTTDRKRALGPWSRCDLAFDFPKICIFNLISRIMFTISTTYRQRIHDPWTTSVVVISNIPNVGFQTLFSVITLHSNHHGQWRRLQTVKMDVDFSSWSFCSTSFLYPPYYAYIIKKHIKSYDTHSILVLVPCF